MSLLRAMQTKDSLTENGMVTNSSSSNHCVNFFFTVGAMRGQDKNRLINLFTKAFVENPLTAMKLLFWSRCIRGGAGERQIFKDIITYLAINRTEVLRKNLSLIPEYGRWDDLLVLFSTPLEKEALSLIRSGLLDDSTKHLISKWMPRPCGKNIIGKAQANVIRKYLGLSPRNYRKLLVENSNTVEQLMCAKNFSQIDYSKLPSKAMSDLMKAFSKNDLDRFQAYLTSLDKGEVKINAGAIYPYDVLKNLKQGNHSGANSQWAALPNFMEGNNERVLPLVDVSGSMDCQAGNSPTITCMDIAISLGLYISERNEGIFKDAFITFHTNPQLFVVKGSLNERYMQMKGSPWGGNTNLEAVFNVILTKAKDGGVKPEEMPTMLLILSDMEFNQASTYSQTAQEMIKNLYEASGYVIPKIVYWNLHSRNDSNKPVSFDEKETVLISGFSPSILTNLLSGKDMTPYSMMMTVIESERYSKITI